MGHRHIVQRHILQGVALSLVAFASMQGCSWNGRSIASSWGDAEYAASLSASTAYSQTAALQVQTDNGRILLQRGGDAISVQAEVKAQTQARADAVQVVTVANADGTVQVSLAWPDGKRYANESASLTITIPDARSLNLQTSNGRIEVASGFSVSQAVLKTSNGAIVVGDMPGSVDAESSNARIELTNVGGAKANTSNGAIRVVLRDDATGPVNLDTSNARVELVVGKAFAGAITVDTSNARIDAQVPRATRVQVSRSDGVVEFGPGAASRIDTSNGAIIIKQQ